METPQTPFLVFFVKSVTGFLINSFLIQVEKNILQKYFYCSACVNSVVFRKYFFVPEGSSQQVVS